MVEDNGTQLFPAFQFKEAAALSAIPQILEAAPHTDGWGILQYLGGGDQGLGGARPLDLLKGDLTTSAAWSVSRGPSRIDHTRHAKAARRLP